ncbi:unnamed protein product, partial [Pleuronectes platessa]
MQCCEVASRESAEVATPDNQRMALHTTAPLDKVQPSSGHGVELCIQAWIRLKKRGVSLPPEHEGDITRMAPCSVHPSVASPSLFLSSDAWIRDHMNLTGTFTG